MSFHSFISVKIFEGGEFPRVRSTGRLDGLNRILKNEFAHFKQMGVEVSISRQKRWQVWRNQMEGHCELESFLNLVLDFCDSI